MKSIFAVTLIVVACSVATAMGVTPPSDPTAVEQRIDQLLAKLTLEQKISLLSGGIREFSGHERPEIGLPDLKMANGVMGVGTYGPSTSYAGGLSLAAAWDPELARRVGESVGDDALARGVHVLLGPGVNLYRNPRNGRNYEYFGEDPYLAARTVVGFVEGVQSRNVITTVKHFAGYNSTMDDASSDIDERTLRELYLPAFEAAVREAHTGGIMCAYNPLNGVDCSANFELNRRILKGDWGFDGILISDWGATHNGVGAANGGLDIEMPAGRYFSEKILVPAVQNKEVELATIDDKVRRILRIAVRYGWLDRPQLHSDIPLDSPTSRAAALDSAREGIVLLKNDRLLLPLDVKKVRVVAVVGPAATAPYQSGSRSTWVKPFAAKTHVEAIRDFLGPDVKVITVPSPKPLGRDSVAKTEFDTEAGQPTFTVETFDNPELQGAPLWTSHERPQRDRLNTFKQSSPQAPRALRWSGRFTAAKSGLYLPFIAGGSVCDAYTLYLDNRVIEHRPFLPGEPVVPRPIHLDAGRPISLRLEYNAAAAPIKNSYVWALQAGLGLVPLEEVVPPEVKQAAASADAVILCVGFSSGSEGEGFDRNFRLPWGQDELIQAVTDANPRTIVVLMSGGGVDMLPWLNQTPAILETWSPGQAGGTALAEVLFGAHSPEGKLPMTFDRSCADNPSDRYFQPVANGPLEPARTQYKEGLFLGYRYYTSENKQTLFPFGFGLSYTTFGFAQLQVPASASAQSGLDVSFDVTNTGDREGAEVAQLYVGDPSAQVRRPVRELKGFQKVRLAPHETKRVTVHLDRRAFAYWDPTIRDWRVDPGVFTVSVGNSSTNLILTAHVTIAP